MELSGKVALITGAAQGIGKAYCEALVRNGVKVAICDINDPEGLTLEHELNRDGRKMSLYIHCDVSSQTEFEESFKQTIDVFGRLDIVINNAGILNDQAEAWEKEVDINLCGVIRGSLLGLKYLKKGGDIVVTTSMAGVYRDSLFPVYSATKGGANYFVRSLGSPICFDHTGIRVIAIAPGFVDTPIIKQFYKNTTLFPEMKHLGEERVKTLYRQKPEIVAACLIDILKEGAPSGSIWLVENDKWRSVDFSQLMKND